MANTFDTPKYEDTIPSYEDTISTEEQDALANYILKPQQTSAPEAALRGAEEGLTFATADELSGLIGAGLETGSAALQGELTPADKMRSLYEEYRNAARKRYQVAGEEHPAAFTAGAVGGSFLVPSGIFGQMGNIPRTASFGEKVLKGAGMGVTAGTLAGIGASEAPIGEQTLEDAATGGKWGLALGAGIPTMASAATATYKGGKALASPFVKGFRHGMKGVDLIGEEAEKGVQSTIASRAEQLGGRFVNELNDLGKQKTSLLNEASEAGVKIDANDIETFVNSRLGEDVETNLPEVRREIEQFRELIRTAKEGPEIERVRRVFYGDKPTKLEDFRRQYMAKETVRQATQVEPQPQKEVQDFEELYKTKLREQEAVPGAEEAPLEIEYIPTGEPGKIHGIIKQRVVKEGDAPGYRKVASKLVDLNNPDEMNQVEKMLEIKRAEQQSVPGMNPAELEVVYEPTTIPVKTGQESVEGALAGGDEERFLHLAVIRQKEPEVAPTETYKKVASKVLNVEQAPEQAFEAVLLPTDDPNLVVGLIRQPILNNKGQVVDYKVIQQKLIPKEEAARFKDITEKARAGGKDLSDPKQLYQLYRDLKQKSTYGDYSFKSEVAQKQTADAMRNVQGMLRSTIPGIAETDAKIHALNKAAELLHLGETKAPDILDTQQMRERLVDFINRQELVGPSGAKARQRLKDAVQILQPHYPELANEMNQIVPELGEQAMTAKATSGIVQPGIVSTPKRWAAVGGNAVGQVINKMANLPPEAIRSKANLILIKFPSQAGRQLSEVLNKMADKTVGERNALLFGLMQNPVYRKWLSEDNTNQDMNLNEEQVE